jgi:hypothetical protein
MTDSRKRTYQNGLTNEVREVEPVDFDWYEQQGGPWYRVEPPTPLDAYPPTERPGESRPKSETKVKPKG